jgi:hypothetical protein
MNAEYCLDAGYFNGLHIKGKSLDEPRDDHVAKTFSQRFVGMR